MTSSFTNLKDLIVQRARKLPGGHALEGAYVVEIVRKELHTFFQMPEGNTDISKIVYFKGVVHLHVRSAAFANELQNHQENILLAFQKALPTAEFSSLRIKIG